jgi:hypothetical protein
LLKHQLGSQFGLTGFGLPENLFTLGAMADNLTSFGGYLSSSQDKRAQDYLNAGTAGYEPCSNPATTSRNFPHREITSTKHEVSVSRNVTTRRHQSVSRDSCMSRWLRLCAAAQWGVEHCRRAVLVGTTNLSPHSGGGPDRPIQQVDLFMDGTSHRPLRTAAAAKQPTLRDDQWSADKLYGSRQRDAQIGGQQSDCGFEYHELQQRHESSARARGDRIVALDEFHCRAADAAGGQ